MAKKIIRVVITLSVVAVAGLLAWTYWRSYLLYPWTRDGQVQAYVVGLAARVSGPIVEVPIVDNQPVARGDLLFVIDPTDYQQEVDAQRAALAKAETSAALLKLEIERRTPLLSQKLISLEDYQILEARYAEAQSDIEVAQAQLALAELNLSYTKVYAPVDGYVTNLVVTKGTYVTKGQPLMALVDADDFWVTGYFRETDLQHITPGKRAMVRLMGHHNEPMEGVVLSVGWGIFRGDGAEGQNLLPMVKPTVDWVRLAQRFPVRVHLLNPREDLALRVGTTASVIIMPDEVALPDAPEAGALPPAERAVAEEHFYEQTLLKSESEPVAAPAGVDQPALNAAEQYPKVVLDGRGDEVVIAAKPQRIISLAPSTTELVYALGAGDRLIADTVHCKYPEAARNLPKVEGFDTPNVEQVLIFQPDLVLASDITRPATVERLREVGLNVAVLPSLGMSGLMVDIDRAGMMLGEQEAAEELFEQFSALEAALKSRWSREGAPPRPRVFLAYDLRDNYTAGQGTFPDELIALAGGENISGDMEASWGQLSMEVTLERDPQILLLTGDTQQPVEPASEEQLASLREDERWRAVSAVREGRVYVLDNALFNIPGPRLTVALEALSDVLYAVASDDSQ